MTARDLQEAFAAADRTYRSEAEDYAAARKRSSGVRRVLIRIAAGLTASAAVFGGLLAAGVWLARNDGIIVQTVSYPVESVTGAGTAGTTTDTSETTSAAVGKAAPQIIADAENEAAAPGEPAVITAAATAQAAQITTAAATAQAPQITTVTETSAPRTTSETAFNAEKHEEILQAAWEFIEPELGEAVSGQPGENLEYHLICVPRNILHLSYDEGYEAHTQEQYDYLRSQIGDHTYRIDDCYLTCKGFLADMCALDYITEDEMFNYADIVADGGRLPDEVIAVSENPEFLNRSIALFNETLSAKRSDAYYRSSDYQLALTKASFGKKYDLNNLLEWEEVKDNSYVVGFVCYWEAE